MLEKIHRKHLLRHCFSVGPASSSFNYFNFSEVFPEYFPTLFFVLMIFRMISNKCFIKYGQQLHLRKVCVNLK